MGSLELVEATEVLAPGERSLAELAEIANHEHAAVVRAGTSMVEHAIASGNALIEAKRMCGDGKWLAWVDANLDIGRYHAAAYMRVAHHAEAVRASGHTSFMGAFAYLRENGLPGPDAAGGRRGQGYADETRREAERLHADGMGFGAIARMLGIASANTVRRWLDPEFRREFDQQASRARDMRRREAVAKRQLTREQTIRRAVRAVRKEGGALAEAYAMVSKLDGVLGQARQEAESKDSRLAINEAHALRDKMMEQIIRALGVS